MHAQQATPPTAPRGEPVKEAAGGRPYEDRVMDGMQALDEVDDASAQRDPQGWPRGITLQLTRNLQTSKGFLASSGSTDTDTHGVQIDAYIETPDYGALSLHALALGGQGTSTAVSTWGLRQMGLPFDGGWLMDNALGTTNLLAPDLARRNSRLALPTPLVLGGSTVLRREGSENVVFGASVGEPGRFEGFPQSRFVGLGGRVSSLFAQTTQGEWTTAAIAAQGTDILPEVVPATGLPASNAARIDSRGAYVSIAQNDQNTGANWQASAIRSEADGTYATGLWVDSIWREGGHRHQLSAYRFDRNLTWIDRPLAADLKGGSYRYDYHSLRWDLATTLEAFDSVSGLSPSGWYVNSSAQRQISTGVSTGGGFAAREYGVTSSSAFAYLQWLNPYGVTRVQLDAGHTRRGQDLQAVTGEHTVYAENGLSLSTTLSLERRKPAGGAIDAAARFHERATVLGLNGRAFLGNNFSLQGSVRARNVAGSETTTGTALAATIGLDWQINRDWSVGGSFYANRGTLIENIAVQSPLVVPEIVRTRPSDRGYFVMLRYSAYAGTPSAPLGGAPGGGAGRIEGSVYLDGNDNGRRDGNESGAANVLVFLDGKFSTRTNAYGGFEFASVASGPHTLTVMPDDLPLPWTVDLERKISAPVSTRGVTYVDIGARRMH